jgi:hypothetical protein
METEKEFFERSYWVIPEDRVLVWKNKLREGKPEKMSIQDAKNYLRYLNGDKLK